MQHAQNKLYVRARVDDPDDVGRAIWNVEADDVGRRDGLNDTPPHGGTGAGNKGQRTRKNQKMGQNLASTCKDFA